MHPLTLKKSALRLLLVTIPATAPIASRAQYHAYNVASGSDCIVQDYRTVNAPGGIYDADHSNLDGIGSSDGGSGSYYGGFTHQNQGGTSTLLQYVCWPASGSYPVSYAQQIPSFAGTNMVGYAQIGEGSSCAIKGYWPQFNTSLWYREAERVWQPADGTPHVGYQGIWMREPASGNWYHVATFTYPFALNALNGMGGWQENFTGYTGDYKVAHAGGYYHKNGAWQKANQISFTSGGHTFANSDATYPTSFAESDCGPDYTNAYNNPNTVTLSDQPAAPKFDPILVSNAVASLVNTQLLVQWQLPQNSSPQLGYRVEVFTNASYTGSVAQSFFNWDPETRQKLFSLTNVATPYVRLTIQDIFYQTNVPVLITPTNATLAAATNPAGTVAGLAYQYYTNSANWTALPNFAALTPVGQGAVNFPDVTPRTQRINYGFNFTGFITAPAEGLYNFTVHSGDGCKLVMDGVTVVNFDGLHDSSQFLGGGIALAAGKHAFNLQFFKGAANPVNSTAYTDGLGLAWEGPGIAKTDVPAAAFSRVPAGSEPAIVLLAPTNSATLLNASPGLVASVTNNGATVNAVRFYFTEYSSYYFRPSQGVDYYFGQDTSLPFTLNSMVWAAPTNLVRARLVYNNTNTLDSTLVSIVTTNSAFGAWYWTPLEMHNYPSGGNIQGNTFNLVGDGMNMLSRQVTGDCTLIARLADITPNVAGPDGIYPDSSWRAGIILRGTTNTTIGQPLGDGGTTRFVALFSSVGGSTCFENDTMRNGNGDANAWSSDFGGNNKWYKIQRAGNTFTSSVSADGTTWTVVSTTNLANFGSTIYAGVFAHALQSMNPNVHYASLDSYSLTGSGVVGAYSVTISPVTNSVIGGLPASFHTSVIGPVPASYQWQLNGTNILNATNAAYSIGSVASTNLGTYTVVANNVTSAPAILLMSAPVGSGVWTNLNGGSWTNANNWTNGLVAGGVDAIADFSTLNLSAAPTVTLDGARTNGTLLFDDANPTVDHNWTLSTGSGGLLMLATSSSAPNISVKSATNIISAVLAGTQGFTKTGPGYLTLSGASPITGTISVNAGTLEVQNKSGDTPYSVAAGATLKLGYSSGGGYANTGLTIYGNGVNDPSGFYFAGGKTYNAAGTITLLGAPSTVRQYGSGPAKIGTFDINSGQGLYCTASASGSAVDANIQMVSDGYGMIGYTDPGINTATGDLTINGSLNVGSLGFYKRGSGSLLLNGVATTANTAVNVQAGTIICGVANCLGLNATVPISSGATLALNGFNQAIGTLNVNAGSTLSFGGTNILTVTNVTLAGTVQMVVNKNSSAGASKLILSSGTLTNGGTLTVVNQSANALAVGDTFTLFSAPAYSGNFTAVNLPIPPVGLAWNTNNLATAGTLSLVSVGINVWNGGGTDNNWNTAANWNGVAPASGNLLYFQGAARTINTNNVLTAAGQIVMSNGGFNLCGNPLALQWGILNLAGNNTNAIITTLVAPQSFICSNGLLAVTAAVTNGGYGLTFDGAGTNTVAGVISGAGGLIKNGSGTLTLSGPNTFTGVNTINAGLVLDGVASISSGAFGAFNAAATTIVVTNGATVDINGQANSGDFFYGMTLAGSGTSGQGALVNNGTSGGSGQRSTPNLTLAANATIGGSGNIYMINAGYAADALTMNGFTLTKTGANTFYFGNTAVSGGGTIAINSGSLSQNNTASTAAGTAFVLANTSGVTLNLNNLSFSAGSLSGGGPAGGNVSLGSATLTVGGDNTSPAAFAGVISGTGGLVKTGTGTLTLAGTNTFTGATAVTGGMLLVNGVQSTGSLTISNGATLGGGGVINGAVTNFGILAPGNGGIGKLTISNTVNLAGGTVLMELSKAIGGATTNDLLACSNALVYAGTLVATNIGTNALAAGDSFKIFNAPSYSGAFTNLNLPALAANLVWNPSGLTNSGTLSVAASVVITNQPQSVSANIGQSVTFSVVAGGTTPLGYQWQLNGTNLASAKSASLTLNNVQPTNSGNYTVIITNPVSSVTSSPAALTVLVPPVLAGAITTGGGGVQMTFSGASGQTYKVVGATNLVLPATNWPVLSTGIFGAGTVTFTDAWATNPACFFRIISP
jgi:autotransporter-associated beta strand protein